jgi:UDP-glucuronate decarboxylase
MKLVKDKKHHNFLIAGGAGFIGSNMVGRLLRDGHEVTVVDDLSTGSEENLIPYIAEPLFDYIKADIREYNDDVEYDRIINLACPASPIAYQLNPIQTMLTNVQGTYNLLGLAYMKGARFLQASTSEVYGDPTVHPQPEEYWGHVNCYGPRACYDEGKRAAEALVYDFQRVVQLDCRIVRIFNTYGPNMAHNDGRVVSNFIVQALQNKPLTIYGDGSQSRSFCYVDDTIEAILRVLEGSYTHPLNVGNPKEFSMLELAAEVLSICGKLYQDGMIQYYTLPQDDPKCRQPNINKIRELYGWEPKIQLKDGLRKTIEYFKRPLTIKETADILGADVKGIRKI